MFNLTPKNAHSVTMISDVYRTCCRYRLLVLPALNCSLLVIVNKLFLGAVTGSHNFPIKYNDYIQTIYSLQG
jgi:hypothetical protein